MEDVSIKREGFSCCSAVVAGMLPPNLPFHAFPAKHRLIQHLRRLIVFLIGVKEESVVCYQRINLAADPLIYFIEPPAIDILLYQLRQIGMVLLPVFFHI